MNNINTAKQGTKTRGYPRDILYIKTTSYSIFPLLCQHDDVIKWKHFPRYWPFVRRIHRWPETSPYKGEWRGALMFLWSSPWINGWLNNRKAGDLRRYRAHYDVIVMAGKRCPHYWPPVMGLHNLLLDNPQMGKSGSLNIFVWITLTSCWIHSPKLPVLRDT